jgi:beta-catenin-like protein 1
LASRSRSIKVLDFALSGPAGTSNCETFVDALGLKTLFSAFMGKVSLTYRKFRCSDSSLRQGKKQKSTLSSTPATEDTSHVLGIIASLFSNLESDSAARVRLLIKFTESEYEKVDKLLELREAAENRLKMANKKIEAEKKVIMLLSI